MPALAQQHFPPADRPPRQAFYVVVVAVLTNTVLALIKILAGILGNSYALVADGIESALDVIGSLIVWRGLKAAHRPFNEDYPYGQGKAEPLAGVVIAIMLMGAAFLVAVESVREIIVPHHAPKPFTLLVLVLVVVSKEILYRRVKVTAGTLESSALHSDAWHHRSDAITSLAAFIGISVALIGGPGWEAADDIAALLAAGIIARNGYLLIRTPLADLLDAAVHPAIEEKAALIAAAVPGVALVEKCRARRSGVYYLIDIHVMVDGSLTVREGHEIAREVRKALCQSALSIRDALVHIEPAES